jgi:hypothetical protein
MCMEGLIVLLLIAFIVILFFKQPNKMTDAILKVISTKIYSKEKEIVDAIYKKIPNEVKKQIPKEWVRFIVSKTLETAVDILYEYSRKK